MTQLVAGKVVAVTGGSNGLGRQMAIAMAQAGAKAVVVGDLQRESRETGETPTVEDIDGRGVSARFVQTDVTRRADVDALVAATEEFGGIDVMVSNAGVTVPGDGVDISEEDFDKLLAVNVKGQLHAAQAAAQQMRQRGTRGSIILMSSTGGLVGIGAATGYDATKGAVILMAKALAAGLGPDGIRVNAIAPNIIEGTHMLRVTPGVSEAGPAIQARTPLRRLGQPADVANAALWLASDQSSFISGQVLTVDGGFLSTM